MEVKRRTDYAIRMMMRMASSHGDPMSVKSMSEKDDVPYQFARAIQRDLASADLIRVVRGARGGAILARSADEISLYDIVRATQGEPTSSICVLDDTWCDRMGGCAAHQAWSGLDQITRAYLRDFKLSTLAGGRSGTACAT